MKDPKAHPPLDDAEPFSPFVFAGVFVGAGGLLLLPRQWVSAGIAFGVAVIFALLGARKRRAARKRPANAPAARVEVEPPRAAAPIAPAEEASPPQDRRDQDG